MKFLKKNELARITDEGILEKYLVDKALTEHKYLSQKKNLLGIILSSKKESKIYHALIFSPQKRYQYKFFNERKGFSQIEDAKNWVKNQFNWYTEGLGLHKLEVFQNSNELNLNEASKKDKYRIELMKSARDQYSNENLVIPIPKLFSKKFVAFCSIREDLLLIKSYVQELQKNPNLIIKSALTYSIISLYGKCYTDASKAKSPKLEYNEINKSEDWELIETHEYLIKLRHSFVAHRGDTEAEITGAFMLIPKGESDGTDIQFKRVQQATFTKETLININNLADFLISNILLPKIQKGAEKAKKGFLDNVTPTQLALMNLNNVNLEE